MISPSRVSEFPGWYYDGIDSGKKRSTKYINPARTPRLLFISTEHPLFTHRHSLSLTTPPRKVSTRSMLYLFFFAGRRIGGRKEGKVAQEVYFLHFQIFKLSFPFHEWQVILFKSSHISCPIPHHGKSCVWCGCFLARQFTAWFVGGRGRGAVI